MRIDRIDLWHVAVPLPAPFRPAWIPGLVQNENRFDLIRLTTTSGIEGWSAAPRMGRERSGLGALLGPYFLGERADDLANVRQRIREMGYLGWNAGWIEPACWDIVGKKRGSPVWKLLGGGGGRVRAYASSGEVRSSETRKEEIETRRAEGFDAFKVRVHAETLDEDIAQIRAARAAAGDELILGVDANQGWRVAVVADAPRWDYERAHSFCRAAEDLGFAWVEEPLPMDDYQGLARLRQATDLAIAGGELNGQGLPEFRVMLEKGCFDWYQPDAIFTGGIAATWVIARLVERAGALYSPHTWTNGIGFAVNLQLFAASPRHGEARIEYPFDPPGWVPEARDGLLTEPWLHHQGEIRLPQRPGLGFDIDRRALRRYGKRFFTATKARVALRAVLDRGFAEARQLGEVRQHRLEKRGRELDASRADPALDALRALEREYLQPDGGC
ncbi:MAG: mandelate racemase/muconate lactonizing enzyme family protein [bacterium]|nr:mandelate racemase/muconate lactonizing enzyme family protein [bacterium]